MKRTTVEPLKAKTTTRPLKKEGASVENDDRTLETINEDETSLPEVTGEIRDKADQLDDDAIIASFNPHQEAFLERLLKKAGYAMGHEHIHTGITKTSRRTSRPTTSYKNNAKQARTNTHQVTYYDGNTPHTENSRP